MQDQEHAIGSPVLFDYPNPDTNIFIMMRFRDAPQQKDILSTIRKSLADYGINALRADDKSYAQSLFANIRSYMNACNRGIAVFEQIDDTDFNPNVSIELGYMISQGKKVLLFKEKRLKALPTDIVGQLYKPFDSYDIQTTIDSGINEWLRDIGVAKSPAEKRILFISYGGTCRCAIAKTILEKILSKRTLPYRLRTFSVAHAYGGTERASNGARRAVYEAYGEDYLQNHRVIHQNPGLLRDADLILTMEENLKVGMPSDKTFNFNDFFGKSGDVPNPWPDDGDENAQKRYRECFSYLHKVIKDGHGKIISYLGNSTHKTL